MKFYVYEHRRASNGATFYVGKGSGRRAFVRSNRNPLWNKIAKKHGFTVHIVKEGLSEEDAFKLEAQIISEYGRLNLCNMSDGGEGISNPSDETREKMRVAKIGSPGFWLGKKRSEDTIRKMSENSKGEKSSRWGKRGVLCPVFGKKLTDEHRKKISEGNKGKKNSEEARKKISEAKRGHRHHMFDNNIYNFVHNDGRTWSGTQFDFRTEHGFQQSATRRLVRGERRKSLHGWKLA